MCTETIKFVCFLAYWFARRYCAWDTSLCGLLLNSSLYEAVTQSFGYLFINLQNKKIEFAKRDRTKYLLVLVLVLAL